MNKLLIAALLITSATFGQGPQTIIKVSVGSATRQALLYLPKNMTATGKYPLLVFLHGMGERGTDLSLIYNSTGAGRPAYFIAHGQWPDLPFIVVSPQDPSYSVTWQQLPYLLKDLISRYPIDTTRIYLTGLSAGGDGSVNYVINQPSPYLSSAAIVPMSAAISNATLAWGKAFVNDSVHVWGFGSTASDVFGTNTKKLIDSINKVLPGYALFTNYSGGHCCWNQFYNPAYRQVINGKSMSIYEWMLQYSRSVKNQPLTVDAGQDLVISLPQDSVVLNGTGTGVRYQWSVVGNNKGIAFHDILSEGGRSFTLKPDAQGYLVIDNASGTYRPGDTLYLTGYYKSVALYNLSGAPDNYITIINGPGGAIIGDSLWSGGAWAQGFVARGCHYIELAGTAKDKLKIIGSNSTVKDASGNPVRTAYIDLAISELSDNFLVHDLSIRHGGVGVFAKTEVRPGQPATWTGALNNFEFYNIDVYNTFNEAMYIGHTAAYWNVKTNQPAYPSPTDTYQKDTTTYKLPLKLVNVSIHDNYVHDIGNDGIQTAAIDNLQLYNNEVVNWGTKKELANSAGLLIGGRVKGFEVHDNKVHDGWGELMQIYAAGGDKALVENNLLYKNQRDGVSVRGTDNLVVTFKGNTVAFAGENLVRINGYTGATRVDLSKNLLAGPLGGLATTTYPKNYIYLENGGAATDVDNKKSAAGLDMNSSGEYGYQGTAVSTGPVIVSAGSASTVVRGLKEGSYTFKLTATDNTGVSASDEMIVTVRPANSLPRASAGQDMSITTGITLTGLGSDTDGAIVSYEWSKVSGPECLIMTPTQRVSRVVGLVPGSYVFRLKVVDDRGGVGYDEVGVRVD
jgi:hypothetical protein